MTADTSLAAYLVRVSLALALLLAVAFIIKLKFSKVRGLSGGAAVEILASLSLGKDAFFVVRCGPDVIAFISGASGAAVIGRWKYDDWIKFNKFKSGADNNEEQEREQEY